MVRLFFLMILALPALGWAAEPVGLVAVAKGQVTKLSADGTELPLAVQDKVFEDDTIVTGKRARVQIILNDDSVYTIGRDSQVHIRDYVYNNGQQANVSHVEARKGVMQFVTGKIAKATPENVKVMTPFATIGVRGSGGVVQIAENGVTLVGLTQCCLDVSANGSDTPPVPLDNVNDYTQIDSPDQPVPAPRPMTPVIRTRLGSALGGSLNDTGGDDGADAAAGEAEPQDDGATEEKPADKKATGDDNGPEKNADQAVDGEDKAKPADRKVADSPLKRKTAETRDDQAVSPKKALPAAKQPVENGSVVLRKPATFMVKDDSAGAASPDGVVTRPVNGFSTDMGEIGGQDSVPLTTLATDGVIIDTSDVIDLTVVSQETEAEESGTDDTPVVGGRLELTNNGRDYKLIAGVRDIDDTEKTHIVRNNVLGVQSSSGLPDPSILVNSRKVADTTAPVPHRLFSAGFVQNAATGHFYEITSGNTEMPLGVAVSTETQEGVDMLSGMKIAYEGSLVDGTSANSPDNLYVVAGDFGGSGDSASTLDNRSYVIGVHRIIVDESDTHTVIDETDTTKKLDSAIVSEAALPKLCSTCAFAHWGVWAGSFSDILSSGVDIARLVPYVLGEKTANSAITQAVNDTRDVNYTGHTFGALVDTTTGAISHHTGNFSLEGTFGTGLEYDANLADYKMETTINPTGSADFFSNLDVIYDGTTYSGAGSTEGAFFGTNAEEVGGQFDFTVDSVHGAGVYLGKDDD